MDIKTLQKHRDALKNVHDHLDAEVLAAADSLKDPALAQNTSIALQKFDSDAKGKMRDAGLKKDTQGIVDAGRGRLEAIDSYVNQNPELKAALDARQGTLSISQFEKIKSGGEKVIDKSALYVSSQGDALSISPEDITLPIPQSGNVSVKVSDYDISKMNLENQYKKLENDLNLAPAGIKPQAPPPAAPRDQTPAPAP